jgi:hypothetical protein
MLSEALAPEIVECNIVRRTTQLADGKIYAFTEILMVDASGVPRCSRTWEDLPDTPFMRSHQIAQFKQRWGMNERAN